MFTLRYIFVSVSYSVHLVYI